jgi:hypothetical protein
VKINPKWSESLLREAASNYSTRSEFALRNKPAYEAARLKGLLDDLYGHVLIQWDAAKVTDEAKKYNSRTEFAKGSGSAYNAARRMGLLPSLFDSKLECWTPERIEQVALNCVNKKELKRSCASAYNAALRLGIIDRLFDNQGVVNARDCVYVWSVNDEPGLYKVGITSHAMGDFRIRQVAKEARFTPTLILLEKVGYEAAKVLERQMKRMGKPYRFEHRFYGYTEFRYFSPHEVATCVQIVKQYRAQKSA